MATQLQRVVLSSNRRGTFEVVSPPHDAASASALPYVSDISMESAVLLQTPLITSITGFLTPEECSAWIDFH